MDCRTVSGVDARAYKTACHIEFDRLWNVKSKVRRFRSRHAAYLWLAKKMGLPQSEAHFSKFNVAQVQEAHRHVKELMATPMHIPPPELGARIRSKDWYEK